MTARRILILRTDRLGETVLTLPVIATLKRAHPQAAITLLVSEPLAALVREGPGVDEVLTLPARQPRGWIRRAMRLAHLLRPYQFDCAIVSNPKKELHLAVWLAGIRWRVGYDRKWRWLLTHRIPDDKTQGDRHEVEYTMDLIRCFGATSPTPSWALPTIHPEADSVRAMLQDQGVPPARLVVVHPWTSHPQKQWPVASFQQLLQRLVDQPSLRVALIGGREEAPMAIPLVAAVPKVINWVGQLSLRHVAEVLRQATVLISNDSGPVHLAAAVGCHVIALFGTTVSAQGPRRWGPWGEGHTVIWKSQVADITVDDVMTAAGSYLQ